MIGGVDIPGEGVYITTMTYFRAPTNEEIKANAERKRQAIIAELCSDAINMLLDDTGPLALLPPEIKGMIQGEMNSVVRTLTFEMEQAEEKSEEVES